MSGTAPAVAATDAATDPLAPVRAALLADARHDAAVALADADAEVDAIRRRTIAECERVRSEARDRGERDAADLVAAERARVRRQARALVLGARGRAYAELRHRVHEAAVAVRDAEDYPALRDRLVARARALVGDRAEVSDRPDGGVVAQDGDRRAVLSLAGLADRTLDRLGPDLEGLWAGGTLR